MNIKSIHQIIVLLFATLLGCSCTTQKRCNRLFPPSETIVEKDSIVYKDTIIHDTIKIDGQDIVFHDTIPCPDLEYHKQTTKGNLTATVNISKGKIDVECHEAELKLHYQKVIQGLLKSKVKTRTKTVVRIEKEYRIPWYIWVVMTLMLAAIIRLLFYVGRKV